MTKHYQKLIHELDPTINPAGVEASMRIQYSTLDHLSREAFADEIKIARYSEAVEHGYLRLVADDYGMTKEYEAWEQTIRKNSEAATKATETTAPAEAAGTWQGEAITNRLHLLPSEQHPSMWDISGKEDNLSALATPQDLIKLAHTILRHFPEFPEN